MEGVFLLLFFCFLCILSIILFFYFFSTGKVGMVIFVDGVYAGTPDCKMIEILVSDNTWFNLIYYHPTGQPPRQFQPFGPGRGILFKAVLSQANQLILRST